MSPDHRTTTALVVFAITYALISGRRLAWLPIGRPAGALLGAVLMVMLGVLTPAQAYADGVLSHDTLGLLLGMMIICGYLEEGGFFGWSAALVDAHVRSPRVLLWATAVLSGGLSALLVNDTVCVVLTPILLKVVHRRKLPMLPYIIALGFGSNVGCALTLTGNPQNMLVGTYSGIPFLTFAAWMALPVLVAMVALLLLLSLLFRAQLASLPLLADAPAAGKMPRQMVPGLVGLGVALLGFLLHQPMAWSALAGAAVVILVRRQDPHTVFARVDFPLLVFFAALFVVMGAVNSTGLVERAFDGVKPLLAGGGVMPLFHLTWLSVVGSQVFSNVPLVQALGPQLQGMEHATPLFLTLALGSTLAGNLTPIGSVANVIVLEYARKAGAEVGFRRFLLVGVPVTAVTTALAILVLHAQLVLLAP